MQSSARSIWFSAIVGAIGFAFVTTNLGFALLWCCLWFGLAIFFIGARRRFPAFVPMPPPASLKDLGIPDHSLGGALSSPWYLLLLIGTVWVCVMAVPLLMPETSLIGFGIGIGVTLISVAAWLGTRQSGSVTIAKRLLGAPQAGERRLLGVVRNDEPALTRETFWFGIAGVHTDSEGNQTPTSNTYGYRQEQRDELALAVEGETATVDTDAAMWAAPPKPLASAPQLRGRSHGGGSMAGAYIRSARAWEREEISRGQRVLALGRWDAELRRLSGNAERPVLMFGLGGDRDPAAALRRELLHRRWPIAALLGLAVIALMISIAMSPNPTQQSAVEMPRDHRPAGAEPPR